MVEVFGATKALSPACDALSPGTGAQSLVPALEVVHAGAEEQGQGGAEEEMVEVARGFFNDPVPLFGVDHGAATLFQHPTAAGVHHQ